MFDSPTDYAPDLEWMLQSGQVVPELLLEALVFEYYSPVLRFAYAMLDDSAAARRIASESFSKSLMEVYKYRPQDGIEIWLNRIVLEKSHTALGRLQILRTLKAGLAFLGNSNDFGDSVPETELDAEIWLAFDRLDASSRQAAILWYVFDWEIERIAKLLDQSIESVRASMDFILQKLILGSTIVERLVNPDQELTRAEIESRIKHSLQKRWPLSDPSKSELNQVIGRTSRRAKLIGGRRRWLVSLVEISVIALIIILGAGIAWGMSRIESDHQPTFTPAKSGSMVLVTEIVYKYITATPRPPDISPEPANPISGLQQSQYVVLEKEETIDSLAEKLDISRVELQNLNRLPDNTRLEPGQRLLLPDQWETLESGDPTPVSAVEPAPGLAEPYLSEMVLQRFAVQGVRANTFWFDAQVIDYGPERYIGPARSYQMQVWHSDEQSLSLIGRQGKLPDEVILRDNKKGEPMLARPRGEAAWFSEWRSSQDYSSETMAVLQSAAQNLFDTRELERGYTFKVLGRDSQAGYKALLIDVFNPHGKRTDQIWYDERRGFILRRISFFGDHEDDPAFEIRVNDIQYDIDIPQQLLDSRLPWRGGFARDPSGAPAPIINDQKEIVSGWKQLPSQSSPIDFDPSMGELTFQYSPLYWPEEPYSLVQLFSDGYALGNVYFGDPWQTICDRSPDGKRIAYVSKPVHAPDVYSKLQWFRLPGLGSDKTYALDHFGVSEFAFSPDSQEIAYFSKSSSIGMGELGVASKVSSNDRSLFSLGEAKSLVWSPDGRYLGMIARLNPDSYLENIVVYDLHKGVISYKAPIDYLTSARQDWPMLEWGVEFPVEMGGMDKCAQRPPAG